MLDSYVDQAEDAANGDHIYIAHYPTPQLAILGTGQLVRRSLILRLWRIAYAQRST
jgi:hypothetical protein